MLENNLIQNNFQLQEEEIFPASTIPHCIQALREFKNK